MAQFFQVLSKIETPHFLEKQAQMHSGKAEFSGHTRHMAFPLLL